MFSVSPTLPSSWRLDSPASRLTRLAAEAAFATATAACVTPGSVRPVAVPIEPATIGLQVDAVAPVIDECWWESLGDPVLNGLVFRALDTSPTLQVAAARVARAEAVVDRADAQRLPLSDTRLDVAHQRFTANGLYPPKFAGKVEDAGNLQANLAWELDFFGKNRSAFESALGAARAAQADRQGARLILASNVVRLYVQLAQLGGQRDVATRTLAQRTQVLELIRQRVQAGIDTQVELRQGEGTLPDTRLAIEVLDEQITLRRHALAALSVQAPESLATLAPSIDTLRRTPLPAQVPADLLGRRADIDAARLRIEAATDDLHSAHADFYPSVNLLAFAGFNAIGLDQLLDVGSRQSGIGAAIRLPIFDAGRLRANYRGKAADLDAAVASYNGAVVEAMHEAADQISSLQSIARQETEQQLAQASAEEAYGLAVERYRSGLGSYLVVLSAETSVLAQRRAAVDLKSRTLVAEADLMRALGGGYVRTSSADQANPPALPGDLHHE